MPLIHKTWHNKRHVLNRTRIFTGEDLATTVIPWVEKAPEGDEVRRLVELSERMRSFEDVRDEMVDHIRDTVEKWGESFVWVASRTPEGGVTVDQVHVTKRAAEFETPEMKAQAEQELAWNNALLLLKRDMLHRIRHCRQCGKLFFARFAHSEYHEEACRLAAEAANPEYKNRRREHMRKQRLRRKRQIKKGTKS
jgi:hypothetical protein